jgi:hypothetical protein
MEGKHGALHGLLLMLGKKGKPDSGEHDGPDGEGTEDGGAGDEPDFDASARDLWQAIKDDDFEGFKAGLRAANEACASDADDGEYGSKD